MDLKLFTKKQWWLQIPIIAGILIYLIMGLLPSAADDASVKENSAIPSLFTAVRIEGPLMFCGEKVRLGGNDTRERMEKEMLLTLWDRPQVVLWIKRANRYLPIIEQKLRQHKMPEDLKYVALVESALRPHAGSPKGAMGFWQFTKSTGVKYGLQIDEEKDERRNVFRSTDAAIAYFKDLYALFGSWTLAAAAFNMGEQGLQAEIMVQKTNDFYDLYLSLETQRYVFRIMTAKMIMTNPRAYGFEYLPADLYPPLAHDRLELECFEETPIAVVAQAAQTSFKQIKDLNPDIRGHYLYAGQHLLLIPKGAGKGFHQRYKKLLAQWQSGKQDRIYIVKQGDNLSSIAKRFNVPLPVLIIWNKLDVSQNIHPGDRLIIFPREEDFSSENP